MALTNEEYNQIIRAIGIELPREGLEEHLNHAYGNCSWNVNQVLRDIESCSLIIRPGKAFWDILLRHASIIPDYYYALGFRNKAFYDLVDLRWLIDKYRLIDKAIDESNPKKATEEIYTCLMETAENAMREFASNSPFGIGEQWYNEHRFGLLGKASLFIDSRLINTPPIIGEFDKKQVLIQYHEGLVLRGFQTNMDNIW